MGKEERTVIKILVIKKKKNPHGGRGACSVEEERWEKAETKHVSTS